MGVVRGGCPAYPPCCSLSRPQITVGVSGANQVLPQAFYLRSDFFDLLGIFLPVSGKESPVGLQ